MIGAPDAPRLEADCVGVRYGERRVLTSASLRVVAGRVTALLGRNGAGKSTLLKVACGVQRADTGTVRMDGVPIEAPSLPMLARRGVFFLADRELLHPRLPIGTQLVAIARVFATNADVPALASLLGIAERLAQRPRELSGGERRRAELALALARAPRVLLADEPLRGIAPLDAEVVMGALRAFARAGGAVAVTGHELPLLLPQVDHVVWCHAGTTRELGAPELASRDFAFRRDFAPTV